MCFLVVLCSIENYYDTDFLIHGYKAMLKWQTKSGCFSILSSTFKNIKTRSINFVGDTNNYCTDHTTGLGMAAIAAHLVVTFANVTFSQINE